MMFLLDVNALLAMSYGAHVHNRRVLRWVSLLDVEHPHDRAILATCPITELGFVRIGSGKARYTESVDIARDDLEDLKASMDMMFIPDDLRMRHLPTWVRKSEQTTDGYLLALADSHGGSLATLDGFIPGSVFIPEENTGPLMVREASYFELASRSREIELR
jgi:predicted nucleic acid-binding protein